MSGSSIKGATSLFGNFIHFQILFETYLFMIKVDNILELLFILNIKSICIN